MKHTSCLIAALTAAALLSCTREKTPVDYVDPTIGNISHLLVPTYPTVHLPNSMLRVYPERADYTSELLGGLPVIVTSHRGSSAFTLGIGSEPHHLPKYSYDHESIKPYLYEVTLDGEDIAVRYAPSHRSAVYEFDCSRVGSPVCLTLNSRDGGVAAHGGIISGWQKLKNGTTVYVYAVATPAPEASGILGNPDSGSAEGRNSCALLRFPEGTEKVSLHYGVSFISEEQARANLEDEIAGLGVDKVAEEGRRIWNETLGRIRAEGGSESEKRVFYTSMYRICERPVCISEGGRYFSAYDHEVHEDGGTPFYTDDWIWDTYRAAHPLRVLTDPSSESDIITSYLRMAEQMGTCWMPTFPEITGDSRRMNCNHGTAMVADAAVKGLDFDLEKAYEYCRKAIEEKTLAPWSGAPAGRIDDFYKEHGYIPALHEGEVETDPNVNKGEKRQAVAVTLGTSYDEWCLSRMAELLGRDTEAQLYREHSRNYINLYNPETGFFHPKDSDGNWIEPFDYRFSGGTGARDYYDENNGWTYRWDVQHDIPELILLMGGAEKFCANLDRTFSEPLGKAKWRFYSQLPDQTGNVGQFTMGNEPSLHIPYLYNYAGQPWKTQKRVRQLLETWFRDDLMGVPGDEDGGGLSSFVVFSMMGFYPVTPGLPVYSIGSPVFGKTVITLPGGGEFTVTAEGVSERNKYIQSATLNGRILESPVLPHDEIVPGGSLVLKMGDRPCKSWGLTN